MNNVTLMPHLKPVRKSTSSNPASQFHPAVNTLESPIIGDLPRVYPADVHLKITKRPAIRFGSSNMYSIAPGFEHLMERINTGGSSHSSLVDEVSKQYLNLASTPQLNAVSKMKDPVARSLLKNNFILIQGAVSPDMATHVYEKVMLLISAMQHLKVRRPIRFIVNSPGGAIVGMNGILDAMNLAKNTKIQQAGETPEQAKNVVVETMCIGFAASAASVIMANGTPGHRKIGENSEIMIHQPLSGVQGKTTDIQEAARRISKMREKMETFFAKTTKLSQEEVHELIEKHDYWMDAQECVDKGFVDEVVSSFPTLEMSKDDLEDFSATEAGASSQASITSDFDYISETAQSPKK